MVYGVSRMWCIVRSVYDWMWEVYEGAVGMLNQILLVRKDILSWGTADRMLIPSLILRLFLLVFVRFLWTVWILQDFVWQALQQSWIGMEYFKGLLWGCLCDVCVTLLELFLEILQSPCCLLLLCAFLSLLIQMFTFVVGEDRLFRCLSEWLWWVFGMPLGICLYWRSRIGNIIFHKRPLIKLYLGCARNPMYAIE